MGRNGDRPEASDDASEAPGGPRERIVRAAAALLAAGGRAAVTTRAVSAAAGVQPPTIYRQFGDLQGLLDAVAEDGFARHLRAKLALERSDDPVADLRAGWDGHVGFGLANPALYALMHGEPRPGSLPPAAADAYGLLEGLVRRVAAAGRLRVDVQTAARMIHAAGVGVVLTLLATPAAARDPAVSILTREAILAAVITDAPPGEPAATTGSHRVAARAAALQAALADAPDELSPAERGLLSEWLDRLSARPAPAGKLGR